MESLILAVMPFVVTGLTSLTKRIPTISHLDDSQRLLAIRLVTAFFAVVVSTIIFALGGDPVTEYSVNELVLAILAFVGGIGGHSLLKNK